MHLAGVRVSSPLTLLQGLHLLNGVTAGRFPNLEVGCLVAGGSGLHLLQG